MTGAPEAALWTALAIPALVFMPNAGGALLGMGYRIWHAAAFALAAVALASSPVQRSRWAPALSGAAAGLSGLCRTEWGLAAAAAAALACLVRGRDRRHGALDAGVAAVAAVAVFGAGLGAFLWKAGPKTVIGEGHVLLTGLPAETRHFLVAFSGIRDWKGGVLELVYSSAMWLGLFLLAAWFARRAGADRPRGLATSLALVLTALAASALLGGAGGAVLFSAAPVVCLGGLAAGLWRRRGSPAAALAASGLLGVLLSYRRPFHIGDSAYVGPPLAFAFVCAAGLLRLSAAWPKGAGARLRIGRAYRGIVAALVVGAFAGRGWQYASLEGAPIAGTAGMLSARPEVSREIEELAALVKGRTQGGDGLVVFPEGEVLNLLSSRRNPIRHKLYLPGYLTADNELEVLRELQAARPASVVLWRRPVTEYDRAMFGEDYGRRIREWIESEYRLEPFRASGAPPRANPRFEYGLRR